MEKTISIDKTKIVSSIQKITGYTGRNTTGGIDRISVTEDENNLIQELINRSFTSLVAIISNYKPAISQERVMIIVPSHFDTGADASLKEEFENYIVNNTCAEWFMIAREMNDIERYQSYKNSNIININNLLSRRVKPIK